MSSTMLSLKFCRFFSRIFLVKLNILSLVHELAGIRINDLPNIVSFGYDIVRFAYQMITDSWLLMVNFALT